MAFRLAFFLSTREIWHNRGRYVLIGLVVTLVTTLVLFIAALAEGLGAGNREFLEKLNGELVVYQANVDYSLSASRIRRSNLNEIRRVEGVQAVGQIAIATASLVFSDGREPLDVSLVGVEPGKPGEPPVEKGQGLGRNRADEVIIDRRVEELTGYQVGDSLTVKTIQGTEEELYDLQIVGISDGRGILLLPPLIVPWLTWDKIRPKERLELNDEDEFVSNIVAVKLEDPSSIDETAQRLEREVGDIEAVDRKTAYEATPGYVAQQSTLDTQRYFTFFIGVLVLGGFFQIQMLQKIAQIGMLKAVGTSTATIALASIVQIVMVNSFGVVLGTAGSLALSQTFPPTVPIAFTAESLVPALIGLMLIGPLGGMVSIWYSLRIEPLTALGLAQ